MPEGGLRGRDPMRRFLSPERTGRPPVPRGALPARFRNERHGYGLRHIYSLAIVLSAVLGLGVVLVLLGLLGHYGIRKGVQHDRFLLAVGRLRSRRGPRHQS